jgi:hypothetical protein
VAGVFERFMGCCVEGGGLVFPERGAVPLEMAPRL